MPATDDQVTDIETLLALPEDGMRHELLEGRHVVTPSPALCHQQAVTEVMAFLIDSTRQREQLRVFSSPADIVLTPKTLVQPDVFVIKVDLSRKLRDWSDVGVPVLAVEILSPSTAARDRGAKREIYQRAGVDEYWIVDLDGRTIERWEPNDTRPAIFQETLRWECGGDELSELNVEEMFARIHD